MSWREEKGTQATYGTKATMARPAFSRFSRFCLLGLFSLFCHFGLFADVVHVYERASTGELFADTTLETGRSYLTRKAPAKSGYIFTHWSISTSQAFEPRDAWGRAYDAAPYKLYEETTLTANYVSASLDSDGDGIADGYEYYWYGNLSKNANSDTDGDGYTFAQELQLGFNPLFPERHEDGPVAYVDGAQWLYNPNGYAPYTIRSEPAGALFATLTGYKRPGETIGTQGTYGTQGTTFAYWSVNGVAQRDAWGRALDSVALAMPSNAVEIVAVSESDYNRRQSLYWYGNSTTAMSSDTDGDGKTFAEELAAGTNPLMPERHEDGPVAWVETGLWQYNPYNLQPFTIRSEPEGALFATVSDYKRAGERLSTKETKGTYGTEGTAFAYWSVDGVAQRDAWGRAIDDVVLRMPTNAVEIVATTENDYSRRQSLYWYGNTTTAMSSDTDGDGKTFAEELAAGTNPLMAERHEDGPVTYVDTPLEEINLQVYETVEGAVVDGAYVKFSAFGANARPIVVDVNGDGRWDIAVVSDGEGTKATNVLVNVGSSGNPEFVRGGALGDRPLPDPLAVLEGLTLDVEPVGALSATTNGNVLLVSDADGRIWYYLGDAARPESAPYRLQHKVWGGSYAGFAEGLMLAAVDWEDDGDLDCLCGTADGRLMLLRNPKAGRPTNVTALAGADSVLLTWDPNQQSRIRGYRVYRKETQGTEETKGTLVASPVVPTYRDTDLAAGDYGYEVSSVSRFYTAGSSTPVVSESMRTAAVTATVGQVRFFWNDVSVKCGERAEVMLSIENSLNYDVAGKVQVVDYDPEYLAPASVTKTGLSEGLEFAESRADGRWTISVTGAVGGGAPILPAGSGKFVTLVFDALKAGTTTVGGATVTIVEADSDPTTVAPYSLGDLNGDGRVDEQDLRDLAKYKNGTDKKYNASNLKAGDFNGNGKLDNADYQALRKLLKDKGALK